MAIKKDPRVDAYIEDSADNVKPMLKQLRKMIHKHCPDVVETIKWNVPFFQYNEKNICGLGAFKAHCSIGFWNDKYIRIDSPEDIPSDKEFAAKVKTSNAYADVNKAKPAKKKKTKRV